MQGRSGDYMGLERKDLLSVYTKRAVIEQGFNGHLCGYVGLL